ncbi:hypothetical protein [Bradyrhizobium diazoefficiens]|uniref:hypothetical protein n=1 Tax=Bradyrhizobium diazoefficiens TaxID=1355477 RepID=UPI002714E157|nr:hypothetical protein [Bradyrhizobium diazoefficiens]WLC16277.1 hypothetical protein QIH76_40465 [Bradyrhizobium diazoefficiens]
MSLADDGAGQPARRMDNRLASTCDTTSASRDRAPAVTDADLAADKVAQYWVHAAESLVLACFHLAVALTTFAEQLEMMNAFLGRLVAKRVLSENDVLARLKANGKLAMLAKIGRHAETLLQESFLPLLPAHYSILYQICLLIEEVGPDQAAAELTKYPEATRDDVIKVRAALKPPQDTAQDPQPPAQIDGSAQLFALRLATQDARFFANEYGRLDTLDECLRHPPPADDAGFVAIVPILMMGTIERTLMPLLGFGAPQGLFFETPVQQPEITNREVIVVAKRGKFWPRPLAAFPSAKNILVLAESFFPSCAVKVQLFAQARADGWSTLIGDENWTERPTVR